MTKKCKLIQAIVTVPQNLKSANMDFALKLFKLCQFQGTVHGESNDFQYSQSASDECFASERE